MNLIEEKWNARYPNFTIHEMHDRHGRRAWEEHGRILIDFTVMDLLQKLREDIGIMQVTSGFRSQYHNAQVGGAAYSLHTVGRAVDFIPKQSTPRFALEVAYEIGFTFAKYYTGKGHVHVQLDQKL